MTIDDRPPRSTSRDLERYAGLFASRTRVMKSSAMRDMMAITARPEVISLAGGLPDTSTFPPETFAAVTARIADESCAKALQYGPTEGLPGTMACIAEVMAAEGMRVDPDDICVTTGGQQVIDLVTKTLIDPGDVVVAEAPTYPGAVPVFSSYQADVVQIDMDADGMRIDLLEETLDRLEREGRKPKFIYTVPTFQNPAGVTMSLERRRRLVEIAHERELLVLEDNPYGLLRYEGDAAADAARARRRRVRDVPRHVLEDPLARHPARLGRRAAAGAREDQPRQAGRRPVHIDAVAADGRGLLRGGALARLRRVAHRALPRAPRHDARRPRRALPAEAEWTRPGGGLFIWATLPDYIDTTDLLARALRENVAFVPGAGAYLDGRGHSSMRLNFSASGDDEIREGVRRIGKVVNEQVALYGTLTGEQRGQVRVAAARPRRRPSRRAARARRAAPAPRAQGGR